MPNGLAGLRDMPETAGRFAILIRSPAGPHMKDSRPLLIPVLILIILLCTFCTECIEKTQHYAGFMLFFWILSIKFVIDNALTYRYNE